MLSLLTRSCFVSTAGNVRSEIIKEYVVNQKNDIKIRFTKRSLIIYKTAP